MRERQLPTDGVHSAPPKSLTQYLARVSAVHPWRVLAAWGLILAASVGGLSLVLLAHFSGAPPGSTYTPARVEDGKLIRGSEK